VSDIQLTQLALTSQVGEWGSIFVAVAIFFFALTSIVANYSYAETNLIFLEHNHKTGVNVFRCFVLGMVMFGALAESKLVWAMADVSMGLMALINLAAILMLSNVVVKLAKDYNTQRANNQLPTFDATEYPELAENIEPGIWNTKVD